MKLPRRTFLYLAAGAAALPTISRMAWAQAYPTRPIRLVDSFSSRWCIRLRRTPVGGQDEATARHSRD